jgi:hypothetical protein
MSDPKPSPSERFEQAVDSIDASLTPFLDKYGLKIVAAFLVAVVVGAVIHSLVG